LSSATLLSHLECGRCGKRHDAFVPAHLCACGGPLLARYELSRLDLAGWRRRLASAPPGLWRYGELLPVADAARRLSLGEGSTPLIAAELSLGPGRAPRKVLFKWEGDNPTGSFKARGMAVAVSRAMEIGARRFVVPTAGNAGVAAAAYVQAGGGELDVFMPADTDEAFFQAARAHGARVHAIDGLISDCGIAARAQVEAGAYDLSTLKEPYRLEGKKTMGYELWEEGEGRLPDVIVYPTGGGTGLIGMWKAFDELEELGLLAAQKPRMVSVQMAGCAPMVRAFQARADRADPWIGARTDVLGLRVPSAVGDSLILRALYESHGTAVAIEEEEAFRATWELATRHGLAGAPEDGAALAATRELCRSGWIADHEQVAVFLTGSATLYRGILARHGVQPSPR
jgi:threonine synthase